MRKNVVMSSNTGKQERQELVLKTRFEVITFCEVNSKVGERKVAEKIPCGKTQIQSILLKKEEIIKDFEANVSSKKKRCRGVNNDEIEKTLLDWFHRANAAGKSEANHLRFEFVTGRLQGLIDLRIEMVLRRNAFLERQ